MLKIGDFSKLSRISVRMLRHYDELLLLKPGLVDEFTGYRYYSEAQLLTAGRIKALKNMGFGLAMIREIMEQYSDPAQLERFLLVKCREMEEQEQQIKDRLRLLYSTIDWLRKDGDMMGYDVSVKTLPQCYVASVRQVIPSYKEEGLLWRILMEETTSMHMQETSPCCSMAIFCDAEYKERDVDVEIQRTVAGTYQDTDRVKFKTVPPVQIASATFQGSYDKIAQVNHAVAKWIDDNGYEFDGLSFNIYHVSPGEAANPDDYVTEVCYPVKRK